MTLKSRFTSNDTLFKLAICLIAVLVILITGSKPLMLSPDSEGYLIGAIYRGPVYPLFLQLLEFSCGDYKSEAIIGLQTLFGLTSSYYLIHTLKKYASVHRWSLVLLFGILLLPYVSELAVGNRVLSEGLSYPLYLASLTVLFQVFVRDKPVHSLLIIITLFVLVLTRTQFIFLVPVAVLIYGRLFYRNRKLKKSLLVGCLIFILPLLTTLADKSYHALNHGHFVSSPWTGIHLLTPAIFTADESDIDLYKDPMERAYFKEMFSSLKKEGLNVNYKIDPNEPDIDIYVKRYSDIANGTLFYKGLPLINGGGYDEDAKISNQEFIAIDQLTKVMTPALIWDNKVDWLKLYIMNFIHGFGTLSYLMVYLIIFIAGGIAFLKKATPLTKAVVLFTGCVLANMAVISIGMHTIQRFTFYNDWVIFLIIFLLIYYLSTQKTLVDAR